MVSINSGVVEFRFFRPDARNVFVVGEFNGWQTNQLRMKRHGDGYWKLEMPIPAGTHRFRYFADGMWYTDFAAFGVEPGKFGLDSVLHVPTQSVPVAAAA